MLNFFASAEGIVFMSAFTIIFILGFLGYVFYKFYKLSGQNSNPEGKLW